VGNYVGDDSPHAKIQNDRPIGGLAALGGNITLAWFLVFLSYPFLNIFIHQHMLIATNENKQTPNFARIPRLNRRTDFYVICVI